MSFLDMHETPLSADFGHVTFVVLLICPAGGVYMKIMMMYLIKVSLVMLCHYYASVLNVGLVCLTHHSDLQ